MKRIFIALTLVAVFSSANFAKAESEDDRAVVEFHIKAGTGTNDWNTEADTVVVKLNDTLRIINDDSINHRLHTDGLPCPHGPEMAPGESYDCVIAVLYNSDVHGPLHDHDHWDARFYIKTIE